MADNNKGKYLEYLAKAKKTFESALKIESDDKVKSNLYTEYSMFLINHHNKADEIEYNEIISHLTDAIQLKDDKSGLGDLLQIWKYPIFKVILIVRFIEIVSIICMIHRDCFNF